MARMNWPLNGDSDNRGALPRRTFIQGAALTLGGLAFGPRIEAFAQDPTPLVRVGLITDVHYADKDTRGTRHYRDSLDKLNESVAVFNEQPPAFTVHLGDFIDAGDDLELELENLRRAEAAFAALQCPRRYVLGNHCVDGLTKAEFIEQTAMEAAHYAFDYAGLKFVVLDACYRSDGEPYGRHNFEWTDPNIPAAQTDWLRSELRAGSAPVIVFAHQRLDDAGNYSVRNAPEVRAVLEEAGNVLAVFQGHSHKQDFQALNGIPYCTLTAMIEGPGPDSSAYAVLCVYGDTSMRIEGFRNQGNVDLPADG